MNSQHLTVLLFAAMPSMAMAQGPEPILPATLDNYSQPSLPNHFFLNPPGPGNSVVSNDNEPANHLVSDAGATLGRVLFYDKMLSLNSTVSCSSCHVQSAGFSDPNVLSIGFEGDLTRRHSMGLANARYFAPGSFFWDVRAASLEAQVLMPIQDSVEMGLNIPEMVTRIEGRDFYDDLYTDAFGDATVTATRTGQALAQFVRSLESYQSRFDVGRAQVGNPNQNFPNFTAQENQGRQIFAQAGCVTCHTTDAQINDPNGPMNNGLDAMSTTDLGEFETTGNPQDIGKFKVPSLRNIAVTGPYMHDGRFATLMDVVNFYNNGVQPHPNLDQRLRTPGGQPRVLNLNQGQRNALVAFMGTFTDTPMLTDPKFSDPFPGSIGFEYCDPANLNSAGISASIHATGSILASQNDVTLHAMGLPANQFNMFIAGPTQDLVMNPGGSQGNLCIGGGPTGQLGRIVASLQSSGALGAASHQLDLNHVPTASAPYEIALISGMTWNFQNWYREPGGNSNFSSAVSLSFF